jgi:hypothetical protein
LSAHRPHTPGPAASPRAGCLNELLELLAKARYRNATDRLVFVGDMVDKVRRERRPRLARRHGCAALAALRRLCAGYLSDTLPLA